MLPLSPCSRSRWCAIHLFPIIMRPTSPAFSDAEASTVSFYTPSKHPTGGGAVARCVACVGHCRALASHCFRLALMSPARDLVAAASSSPSSPLFGRPRPGLGLLRLVEEQLALVDDDEQGEQRSGGAFSSTQRAILVVLASAAGLIGQQRLRELSLPAHAIGAACDAATGHGARSLCGKLPSVLTTVLCYAALPAAVARGVLHEPLAHFGLSARGFWQHAPLYTSGSGCCFVTLNS